MAFARTVLGDIDSATLGVVNAHEHLAIGGGLITVQHPDYRLNDVSKAVEEIRDFVSAGGSTIVDCTPCGIGREPETLIQVAQSTGVHIIGASGVHKESYYLDSHWRFHYSVEQIADLWRSEVQVGMELSANEGPIVRRSAARAGIVKVGSDYQKIHPATVKAFEAAALVHQQTGVPILTHSEMGTMMMEQVELLSALGVAPEHVVISHGDRNPDWFVHRDVAQTGAFIEYDCPGRVKYFPESTIIDLIRKMFDLSCGGNILLGGDNARRSYWKAYGGGPGVAYLLRSFIPRLKREGFHDEQIQSLFEKNPAAAFSFVAGSVQLSAGAAEAAKI